MEVHLQDTEDQRLNTLRHDLRQYVATGLLLSRVAEASLEGEARTRLATIHTLFDQIRELINAEVDEPPRQMKLDLTEVVTDCVRIAEVLSQAEIRTELESGAAAYGDPVMLRRAVTNLLDNATRATSDHDCIYVQVSTQGDDGVIAVSDTGVGFGRAPHGTGLGMGVVMATLRACGGRLEILSGPLPGTTVRMVLPRAVA